MESSVLRKNIADKVGVATSTEPPVKIIIIK
jgi:hypothetical protein